MFQLWHHEVFNDNAALLVNRNEYSIRHTGNDLFHDFVHSKQIVNTSISILIDIPTNISFVITKLSIFGFVSFFIPKFALYLLSISYFAESR